MSKVTCLNFKEKYPAIQQEIKDCTFLAFDCEFSGLSESGESLFDTPSQRYTKIRRNVSEYLILQLGLGIFKYDRSKNVFKTSHYSFYLLPNSTPVLKNEFQIQTSAAKFLTRCNFDFTKVFKEGLGYLTRDEEKALLELLKNDMLSFEIYKGLSFKDKDDILTVRSEVASWAAKDGLPDLVLECPSTDASFLYYLSSYIRSRFPSLWTSRTDFAQLTVTKVTDSQKLTLKLQETHEQVVDDYFREFSKVFSDVCSAKKPLVGHNCIRDLIMMYQQFIGPLPAKYEKFKTEIQGLFPCVYDTKQLTHNLRLRIPRTFDFHDVSSLEDVYTYFREGSGSKMMVFAPSVDSIPTGTFHDAGFDAFCTGYCFIRLTYLLCTFNKTTGIFDVPKSQLRWASLMAGVEAYKNCLNLIRAQMHYIRLDGPDPVSERPDFLHIESKKALDRAMLESIIARVASCDFRYLSRHRVLLAVANHKAARDILQVLQQQQHLQVTRGVPVRHRLGLPILAVGTAAVLVLTIVRLGWISP